MRDTALWPCFEIKQQSFLIELPVGFGVWSEVGPNTYHEVGIHPVHRVNHHLPMPEPLTYEVHGIPGIVASPVLPVLYDTVKRNIILTMPVNNLQQFVLSLVSLTALPVAECPQWEHVYFS